MCGRVRGSKKPVSDGRPDRALLLPLKNSLFGTQLFSIESSDSRIPSKTSWIGFLSIAKVFEALYPSKTHGHATEQQPQHLSDIGSTSLRLLLLCSAAAVAAAHSAQHLLEPARGTRSRFQNTFARRTPKSTQTKITNSIQLTIGKASRHTPTNLQWVGNRPIRSFQSNSVRISLKN